MRRTAVRLQPAGWACLVALLLTCAPLATDSKRARRKARPSASGESRGSGVGARRPAAAAPPQPWESPSAATEPELEECLGGLRSGVPPPLQPAALVERWTVTKAGNDELRVGDRRYLRVDILREYGEFFAFGNQISDLREERLIRLQIGALAMNLVLPARLYLAVQTQR